MLGHLDSSDTVAARALFAPTLTLREAGWISPSTTRSAEEEVDGLAARPNLDGGFKAAEERRRAAAVRLHPDHPLLGLEGQPSRVVPAVTHTRASAHPCTL